MLPSFRPEYSHGQAEPKICRPTAIDEPTWELKTFRYLEKLFGIAPQKRRIRLTFRRTFTPLVCIVACSLTVLGDVLVLRINEPHRNSTTLLLASLGLHGALLITALGLGLTTAASNATYVVITVVLAGVNGVWDALCAFVCCSIVWEVIGRVVHLQEFVGRYFVIQVASAGTKLVSATCLGIYAGVTIVDVLKYRLCAPIEMEPFPEMAIRDPLSNFAVWKGWRESDSEAESFFTASDTGIPLQTAAGHYDRRETQKRLYAEKVKAGGSRVRFK